MGFWDQVKDLFAEPEPEPEPEPPKTPIERALGGINDKADEMKREIAKEAAKKAASAAAAGALAAAKAGISKVGEDFLSFAEKELADAEASRKGRPSVVPDSTGSDAAASSVEAAAARAAERPKVKTRAEKEAAAREELERLKKAMGKK